MKSKLSGDIALIFRQQKNLIFLAVLTIMLSACDKAADKKTVLSEHYDIIDSTYNAEDHFTWFDNDNVIFSGSKSYTDGTSEKGIYIWNINNNKVKRYAKEGLLNCYYNDHIFYFSHAEHDEKGRRVGFFTSGKLGEEKTYSVTVYKRGEVLFRKKPFKWIRNNFSCKKNYMPKEMENHVWIPLLEEHGYLDFGLKGNGRNSNDNVFLHKQNGDIYKLNFQLSSNCKISSIPIKVFPF